jgi:anti-sigma factor RsiW
VIREDRELLAELALLNTDVVPLAMRVMEGSATAQEQRVFAQRLIAAGERLHHRADESERVVIDGEVTAGDNGAIWVNTGISTVS